MESRRPTRWRRRDARRRSSIRRLLLAGAIVGLAGGLLAQSSVEGSLRGHQDLEWLVRLALVLPALIFVAWWLLSPGIADEPEELVEEPIDADERLERIEATFDDAAVPRAAARALPCIGRP
jgi:hypothetical protein